ncbi:hypothetical protein ACFYSH_20165 [Streptomyces sp. NPDC005791]|uniref:hypothetical protein n=1 Tax=Streptomyces sp. NPDC005791 TaxID=3364732 RepID=UPI003687708D
MLPCNIRILETLLRLLRPAPPAPRVPPTPVCETPEPVTRPGPAPERGLWLAMYGIDTKPCSNCGMWGMT